MAITIKKNLVASSKHRLKAPYSMNAKYITVHNTYNDAPAANEVNYMVGNNQPVSFHYAVDGDGVVQGVPVDRSARHTGDGEAVNSGNRTSIGVEICYSKSGGDKYKKAEAMAIKFIAQLLKERGWGIDRIRKHQDWSGKYCPHRILAEGRWDSFKASIEKELKSITGKTSSASKPPKTPPTKTPSKSTSKAKYTLPKGIFKVSTPMMKGTAVKQIQEALAALYFYPEKGAKNNGIDGYYGAKTADAVRRFQSMHGLVSDGIYGDKTRAKLASLLK